MIPIAERKMPNPEEIATRLERILPIVQKPGRYTGGEFNQILKDWQTTPIHVALLFPDIYELGMSNLGLAILYDLLNQRTDTLAERAYCPWIDMEKAMREANIPLFSLESKHPIATFDIVGFSLPYETLYTNTLNALDLAGIPLFTHQRNVNHPLIIAGGHATYNPEPMHPFVDAFVIGEGEEVIHDIIEVYRQWKDDRESRAELLRRLARIWGVYVPSLYQDYYHLDGTFSHIEPLWEGAPLPILKRIVPRLPPPPTRLIVPYIDITHNRVPIEIMRGCTRGCRFCHAGMVTRPVRERSVDEIVQAIEKAIEQTGFEEVGLLSLSSSDHSHIVELVTTLSERFSNRHLTISLPSLRIETVSVELMEALKSNKRSGFTLAPEAATEKMRSIINKPIDTRDILETARSIFSRGWTTIKLYFMIGLPNESLEDVEAIADLCKTILREGRRLIGHRAQVHVGVSTFIPKPHTPFQWSACDRLDNIQRKIDLLRRHMRGQGLKLTWNEPEETLLEGCLSRGDRRMSEVVFEAWKHGAKFDAWHEQFNYQIWLEAFHSANLQPEYYSHRLRATEEALPWDHIHIGVRKQFLIEDYLWSQNEKTRNDCRFTCFACGILPTFSDLRRENPGDYWRCPQVLSPKRSRHKPKYAYANTNNLR